VCGVFVNIVFQSVGLMNREIIASLKYFNLISQTFRFPSHLLGNVFFDWCCSFSWWSCSHDHQLDCDFDRMHE